ncbi:hypothetical protein GF342_05665 [Candidatus Woesearchaeota archaeon]|nr:hypothetical protein [Candidatus Woesearchaeota archaeon]
MRFSRQEIKELGIAWFIVALAFSIVMVPIEPAGTFNTLLVNRIKALFTTGFLQILLSSLVTIGVAVVVHELAHKFVGQYYGAWSEFRMMKNWLLIGLVMSFLGFLFMLPGAVHTRASLSQKKWAIISLAGPASNFILGWIFYAMTFVLPAGIFQQAAVGGAVINFFLAFFNLVPIDPIDGAKVMRWNKFVWGISIALCAGAVFAKSLLFG